MTDSTPATAASHEYAYDHRCVRIVNGEVCYRAEDDPVHQPATAAGPTREALAEALSATASLLYDVWRCNTDEERSALGTQVAATVEQWAVHPSWILSGERP